MNHNIHLQLTRKLVYANVDIHYAVSYDMYIEHAIHTNVLQTKYKSARLYRHTFGHVVQFYAACEVKRMVFANPVILYIYAI